MLDEARLTILFERERERRSGVLRHLSLIANKHVPFDTQSMEKNEKRDEALCYYKLETERNSVSQQIKIDVSWSVTQYIPILRVECESHFRRRIASPNYDTQLTGILRLMFPISISFLVLVGCLLLSNYTDIYFIRAFVFFPLSTPRWDSYLPPLSLSSMRLTWSFKSTARTCYGIKVTYSVDLYISSYYSVLGLYC